MDILVPFHKLMGKRKLFHSEADFQFALAWEIQLCYPQANVRLEYCPSEAPNMHIDVFVRIDNDLYPIELKYKTMKTDIEICNEVFHLKNHGAQDIGKYDFLADLYRIEWLSNNLPHFKQGFVIWLSNDPSYWNKPARTKTIYEAFSVHHEAIKNGSMSWAAHAGAGTTKDKTDAINLYGTYTIAWEEYSKISEARNGTLMYSVSIVNPPSTSVL